MMSPMIVKITTDSIMIVCDMISPVMIEITTDSVITICDITSPMIEKVQIALSPFVM